MKFSEKIKVKYETPKSMYFIILKYIIKTLFYHYFTNKTFNKQFFIHHSQTTFCFPFLEQVLLCLVHDLLCGASLQESFFQ